VQFADIHRVYGTKTDQVLELQKSLSQAEYDAHKYKTRVLHLATVEMKQIMETKESEIQNQLLEMERLENSLREETIRREECTSELTELRQSIQEDKKQQQQQALLISSSSDDEDDDCNATDTIPGGPKEGLKNTFLDLKKQCKAHAAEAQEVLIEIKKKDSKSIPPLLIFITKMDLRLLLVQKMIIPLLFLFSLIPHPQIIMNWKRKK